MIDLSTTYLGLKLKNPIVPSASPLSESLDNMRMMEDFGAPAIVMHSLFEEQITHQMRELDYFLSYGTEFYPEALSYFPEQDEYKVDSETYLEHIRRAKQMLEIPIIGSLNGVSTGGWTHYARLIEQAGADALELNVYYIPTAPHMHSADVEQTYFDLVRQIRSNVKIPVAVKLSHFFSSIPHMIAQLDRMHINGLVMFNRFYQPDIDLDTLEIVPNLNLSHPNELRLRLRWVAIMYGRIKTDMAVTGGVHSAQDVIKSMLVGAKVAMTTSALLRYGIPHLRTMLIDLEEWMEERDYESIKQMRGSMSQRSVVDPAAFERANYIKALKSFEMAGAIG